MFGKEKLDHGNDDITGCEGQRSRGRDQEVEQQVVETSLGHQLHPGGEGLLVVGMDG